MNLLLLLPALIHLSLAPFFLHVILPTLNLPSASCQVKGTMGVEEEEEKDTEMGERAVTPRRLSGNHATLAVPTVLLLKRYDINLFKIFNFMPISCPFLTGFKPHAL